MSMFLALYSQYDSMIAIQKTVKITVVFVQFSVVELSTYPDQYLMFYSHCIMSLLLPSHKAHVIKSDHIVVIQQCQVEHKFYVLFHIL